jgi:glycosyltransferase involved in cell wall biosynthesis
MAVYVGYAMAKLEHGCFIRGSYQFGAGSLAAPKTVSAHAHGGDDARHRGLVALAGFQIAFIETGGPDHCRQPVYCGKTDFRTRAQPGKNNRIAQLSRSLFRISGYLFQAGYLLQRYGLQPGQPVLLTISRLNAREGYKGYDKVLACLPELLADYPNLQYILAGKSDEKEHRRLTNIIRELGLESCVHLPGFLPDAELSDHYLLADVFVMPSKKEGFGLVFIEALAHGVPVVAGNADGSAEALQNGRLGLLIDPDDPAAIAGAIRQTLQHPGDPAARQKAVAAAFNYPDYKTRLWKLLSI